MTDFAYKNTRKLHVFHNRNVADVKLETDIVEKRLFAVKEKTTCYIYTFSYYDHATITNVMFCNQRFPWLLAEALFYM